MDAEGTVSRSAAKVRIDSNFKLMSIHTGIARTGTSAFSIAILWLALSLTGSPVAAGFADSMFSLPLFLSFVFGAYIDNLSSKRNLAVISSSVRAGSILILFIPMMYDSFLVRVLAIYTISFLLGMTSDILNSIRSSWSKQFLDETQYKKGTSLLQTATSMAQGCGFAISGILLSIGVSSTIYVLSLLFLASTIPLAIIKDRTANSVHAADSIGSSIASGLRYIKESNALKAIIVITLFVNLAFGTVGIFFAYLIDYSFQLPAYYYGFLFVFLTVGLAAGSVAASGIRGKIGFYNSLLVASIGILLLSMSFFRSVYPDYALVFLIGIMIGMVNVISQTGILKIVRQDMIARVYGAFSTFGLGITFLSGGIGGLLIDYLTLSWSFVLIGGIVAAVAASSVLFREYYNITI